MPLTCPCESDRKCNCGDCDREYILLTEKEHLHLIQYAQALEHTRADLWGANAELRAKISALEAGQQDLLDALDRITALAQYSVGKSCNGVRNDPQKAE